VGRAHRRPHRDADAQAAKSAAEGEQLRNTVAALRAENQLLRERLSSVAHTAESEHNQHSHWRVRTGMEATVPFMRWRMPCTYTRRTCASGKRRHGDLNQLGKASQKLPFGVESHS